MLRLPAPRAFLSLIILCQSFGSSLNARPSLKPSQMARNEAMSVLNLSNETIISFSEENLTPDADPESSRHLESPTTIEKSAVQIGGTMFLRSRYGMTLALSGNGRFLATNGMAGMDGNGYTHVGVMENQNGSWKQVGNPIEGFSVAISCDGLTIAVRVYRLLRVYRWNGKAWSQGGKENAFPVREYNGDDFRSVSLSGDGTVVALAWDGNYDTNDPGRMEIYKWNGSWQEMGNFQDHVGHNIFPTTTALSEDGSVVAVCVPYVGSNSDGYIVVYQWDGDGWIQLGNRILGEGSVVFESVDISSRGNILAAAGGYGYVKIFELKNGDWQQLGQTVGNLTADLGIAGTRSISISGDGSVVSVGALRAENSVGQVRLFQFDGTLWQQLVEFPGESSWVFRYVTSVSKDGSTVAFGGRGNGRTGSYPDEDHKFISVYSLDPPSSSTHVCIPSLPIGPTNPPVTNTTGTGAPGDDSGTVLKMVLVAAGLFVGLLTVCVFLARKHAQSLTKRQTMVERQANPTDTNPFADA